jgi:hypothetical protein
MEQKQRRVKPGEDNSAETETLDLPEPPPIDDLIKAAEMAAEEQRKAKALAEAQKKKERERDCDCCGCW